MTTELLTFTNCKHTKAELLASLRRHAELDQIVQGVYWTNGKGCAVGCSIRDFAPGEESKHGLYETLFGIEEEMAQLEDNIFEYLPADLAKTWPIRFTEAIPEGVSLTVPLAKFKVFLLTEVCKFDKLANPQVAAAIDAVVALLNRRIVGDEPHGTEWSAAMSVNWAAMPARVATRRHAAYGDVWSRVADNLIEILEGTK